MKTSIVVGLAGAVLGCVLLVPSEARACGGCFGEQPTVVTDHRMVFSVWQDKTTLYDQIVYSGDPKSFAWVLPIVGQVEVAVSSDVMFRALDQQTATTIRPPPRNCPAQAQTCDLPQSAGGFADGGAASGGVDVLKSEVVGPYETVQLRSTDPGALNTWLVDHAFVIPEDNKPIIAQYVTEHFDFLAIKLVPGKSVTSMRPIAITTVGASAVLPLRMVGAGAGANVGITLWVVSEGRYAPQNFPFFRVADDEIVWDWNTNASNYRALRQDKSAQSGGRAWEIESSTDVSKSALRSRLQFGTAPTSNGDPQVGGYLPELDGQGKVTKSSQKLLEEDMARLLGSAPSASVRVTRMRADLARAALDKDLLVTASSDQAALPNVRQVTREANEPLCPVYDGCEYVGQAPRSEAGARKDSAALGGGGCTAARGDHSTGTLASALAVLSLAGVAAARSRRARPRR